MVPADLRTQRDLFRFLELLQRSSPVCRLGGWYFRSLVMGGLAFEVARMGPGGLQSVGSNFPAARDLPDACAVDYLEACNMAFRRPALAETGGFDPSYRGTGEWNEPDLAFRIRRRGGRLLFEPAAAVEHRPSQSGVYAARTAAAERMHNHLRFYFRWMWRPARADAFLATVLMFNAFWIVKFLQSRDPGWLSGVAATASGLIHFGLLRRERAPEGQ